VSQDSAPARLVVMDVDSTLITAEVIELLAAHAGAREQVAAITERAMRGELDFAESLRERVATLAGLPTTVFAEVLAEVVLSPGAEELIAELGRRGWPVALVSGGFVEVVGPLASRLGITRYRANTLEVVDGRLTGRVEGEIVDRAVKARTLRELAAELGVPMERTLAIGDGGLRGGVQRQAGGLRAGRRRGARPAGRGAGAAGLRAGRRLIRGTAGTVGTPAPPERAAGPRQAGETTRSSRAASGTRSAHAPGTSSTE
jgi:phosphoserine phosphatase